MNLEIYGDKEYIEYLACVMRLAYDLIYSSMKITFNILRCLNFCILLFVLDLIYIYTLSNQIAEKWDHLGSLESYST